MFRSLLPLCTIAIVAGSALPAAAADLAPGTTATVIVQAATPPPRTINLTTSSHVEYAPDLAVLSFGVHSFGPTAAEAANHTNTIAARMIAAFTDLGIEKKEISTTAYTVEFTAAQPPTYAPAPCVAGQHCDPTVRVITQPGHGPFYTVSATYAVKAPIAKAGPAIDGAVKAGANDSYSLSFMSSHLDDFYAQALASAMQSARSRATALAAAAGVSIDTLQSVTTSGAPSSDAAPPMEARASFSKALAAPAPVVAGTMSVDATVDATYTIK